MSALKLAKLALLQTARTTAFDRLVSGSAWRESRFTAFCFHGISTEDEHECYPGFFLTREQFRHKLQAIRDAGANVLPLDEALARLAAGTLPKRSIVITIDDGFHGAFANGARILEEFGIPATVYMTTHYVKHNRPVFDNMCGYLVWKGLGSELRWERVLGDPIKLERENLSVVEERIGDYAAKNHLDSERKDHLLAELADCLSIDYEALRRKRLLHLVNPDEMRSWRGVRFELHTHRHRVSKNKAVFDESVSRNREEVERITGIPCKHLAYPGGAYLPEHPGWLRELGLVSAITCETGIVTPSSDLMRLPRVMDTLNVWDLELNGWVTGMAALLPTRAYPLVVSQLE